MTTVHEAMPAAKGRVRALYVPDFVIVKLGRSVGKSTSLACKEILRQASNKHYRSPKSSWQYNLILRSWAGIVGKLLTTGESKYRISGMYIEFMNVASPGDPAPIPSFDRDPASGIDYYNALSASPSRDYLRVPMIAAAVDSSDQDLYPDGNLITFFAQTSGVVGTHGKNFGEAYNSTVIGGALVAQLSQADATQDMILSRFYFEESDQQPKLDTGQVGLEWQLELQ